MSLLKTLTDKEREILKLYGLDPTKHSQLNDCFILGLRHHKRKESNIND